MGKGFFFYLFFYGLQLPNISDIDLFASCTHTFIFYPLLLSLLLFLLLLSGIACALVLLMRGACGPLASPCPWSVINSTANNNGNPEGPSPFPPHFPNVRAAHETHLACVNGIIVGGFGGCCGTISPRRGGPRCGSEISPADLNEITPVLSRLFEKRTRPP